ncbi:hypothetical protein IMG5_081220 [Ichthyophthirius multifiliis]|uniref:Eukaryotic translation initiation factor 4C n=1 Tax=Ichthyophthirius multifiliis TaxID=5932 RepID=G0QQM1_ICHMU|nr:hypothetical protein IMG5_081220 [Ichthyophthirius multifiliis]EGR32488.1 hypothetical protein IMG5_081220 [Ichthyophthirius multifiliis]|eukprot:XP_004036474.1 hypothetical protein IMG5_081220 [Ichthyophthirius multifiliis]
MPKNKSRGGKNYRRGKNESETKRELVFKEEDMEYAQVTKILGNGRLELYCFDGKKRIGHICGRMKKKVWIQMDDIVLAGLRDFQDEKCDIILKYLPDEIRALKQYGEIPENIKVNEKGGDNGEVVFEDSDDQDSEEDQDEKPVQTKVKKQVVAVSSSSEEEEDAQKKDITDKDIDDI